MNIYKGIIEGNNLDEAINYIGYELTINEILILMKYLSPDFVEIDSNIYLYNQYIGYGDEINRFDNSK